MVKPRADFSFSKTKNVLTSTLIDLSPLHVELFYFYISRIINIYHHQQKKINQFRLSEHINKKKYNIRNKIEILTKNKVKENRKITKRGKQDK